ncbi:RNA polymerase sigma factor [Paenibacillus eucommiae]|uniref:RNA polymerase sigma factor (SigM family) n=1 Tax=Paenibacillus eucommiae TaxID=1355755 RepID=A0ABS4ITG1_9BACL|nr:sigma-70 family RNA polymerase sigma factor [Paenibacillus eucommiae]MBP1990863.1 RNA polymerase sigma factor (SigM family) [Paenibacillus eucommiae]
MLLTMKNIVKVVVPFHLRRVSSTAPLTAKKSPPTQRKTLAGCLFELGVRAIVAREREWLWAEERKRPPLKICSNLIIHSVQGNKSITAAGAHSHSLVTHPSHEHAHQSNDKAFFLNFVTNKSFLRSNLRERGDRVKEDTYAELFRTFQPSLYLYLYRMCGTREVAEELLQETFYRAMLSLRLEDTKMARAWLYKVARHLFVDWLRKQNAEKNMFEAVEQRSSGISTLGRPEEALRMLEEKRKITDVMKKLPEHYRTLLYLREMEGFTYQELVATLEITMSQVKVNLHRAREKFKLLAQQWERGDSGEG